MTLKTPNFTGWRAVILSEADGNTDRLRRQLGLLGVSVTVQWTPLSTADLPDLVLIDADRGWDELLPFSDAAPACPVVALLGSEAPGRIAWALRHGAGAIIPKPVSAWKRRLLFLAAVPRLAADRHLDEERAYAILRDCAMRRRLPIEQLAAFFLGGSESLREVG